MDEELDTSTAPGGIDWQSWADELQGVGGGINWSDIGSIGKALSSLVGGTSAAGGIGQLASTYAIAKMLGLLEDGKPAGYRGGIPQYTLSRAPLQTAPAAPEVSPLTGVARRPGEYGRRYFAPMTYTPTGSNLAVPTAAPAPAAPAAPATDTTGGTTGGTTEGTWDSGVERAYAHGGITMLAEGGEPRYLQGSTDGMEDELRTTIDGEQPAALSHGEFVVPADVVSHLGNGNSEAGAKVLYKMMDRVRQARTGTKEQGKKINPEKFTPGGIAGYAEGGIAKFEDGGSTDVTAGTAPVSKEQNLSEWIAPYVVDYLGKGQALAGQDYVPYMGPLTAGESALQSKVFSGLESLQFPGQLGKSFTAEGTPTVPSASTAGPLEMPQATGIAAQYMNPYLQAVLQPQLQELRRQGQITELGNAAKATQAGAFGGARGALMGAETQRNLLDKMNEAIGTGYASAYDKGLAQFNLEQGQAKTLAEMMAGAGSAQRGITAEGIAADRAQFEEERLWPYKQLQFQQSLITGLPTSTSTASTSTSPMSQALGTVSGLGDLGTAISKLFPSS
jgi:hypothetical protein